MMTKGSKVGLARGESEAVEEEETDIVAVARFSGMRNWPISINPRSLPGQLFNVRRGLSPGLSTILSWYHHLGHRLTPGIAQSQCILYHPQIGPMKIRPYSN